jgi:hypothetical protein
MTIREVLAIARKEASPLARKALGTLPRWHLFSPHLNLLKALIGEKLLYWFFRCNNRAKVLEVAYLQREMHFGHPFIVVANHDGLLDVYLHQAVHAHLDHLVTSRQIVLKFGPAFTLDIPEQPTREDLKTATETVMRHIATIWGQKRVWSNTNFELVTGLTRTGDDGRIYDH